ncbi:hypothetical protein SCHPADRAFT_538401 [Schizopora paradoxa]|uniref:Uncharacterized protein n=1 Tax=Schizopora paradoxa TaxID=27342 RepID=A0A0H2REM3_9AGAM|nr:hypothetical protein SCHPADRAFT_538401 [Schizopora paradoxa]
MVSLHQLYRTLPYPWDATQSINNNAGLNLPPHSPAIHLSPRGCPVTRNDRYPSIPGLIIPSIITSPPIVGVQAVVTHLLRNGFARADSAPANEVSVPVSQLFNRDFGAGWDRAACSIEVTTILVDSTYAQQYGVYFVSANVSVQFRGNFRRYVLLEKMGIGAAAAVYRLLGQ